MAVAKPPTPVDRMNARAAGLWQRAETLGEAGEKVLDKLDAFFLTDPKKTKARADAIKDLGPAREALIPREEHA